MKMDNIYFAHSMCDYGQLAEAEAAPILRWTLGKSLKYIEQYCKRKWWKIKKVW